jgi:hypothetical protein
MKDTINVFKILVDVPEGKSPLRKPSRIWQYNIKADPEVAHEGVVRIHVAQAREQCWTHDYQLLKKLY